MPMKYKSRRYRKRRAGGRRAPRMGVKGGVRRAISSIHRFKELYKLAGGYPNATANATNSGVMTFRLGDVSNASSFASLFDLYKITGARVKIVPNWSTGDVLAAQTGTAAFPMLYIAENRDPYVGAPTSVADVLNDDGCKVIALNKPINLYLKNPKPEIITLAPEGEMAHSVPFQFNSSSKALQPWLTTGSITQFVNQINVNHFGYRWFLDNSLANVAVSVNTYVTLYFTLKEAD